MIEQPLWHDDFYSTRDCRSRSRASICLDEAIHNRRDAQAAVELGSCRIINIKVGRVGGFKEAIAIHNVGGEGATACLVWGDAGRRASAGRTISHCLPCPISPLPGDVSASKRYWKEDIIEPEVEVSPQGFIKVPETPGRGFKLRADLIEKLTVRKQTLRAGASSAAD